MQSSRGQRAGARAAVVAEERWISRRISVVGRDSQLHAGARAVAAIDVRWVSRCLFVVGFDSRMRVGDRAVVVGGVRRKSRCFSDVGLDGQMNGQVLAPEGIDLRRELADPFLPEPRHELEWTEHALLGRSARIEEVR